MNFDESLIKKNVKDENEIMNNIFKGGKDLEKINFNIQIDKPEIFPQNEFYPCLDLENDRIKTPSFNYEEDIKNNGTNNNNSISYKNPPGDIENLSKFENYEFKSLNHEKLPFKNSIEFVEYVETVYTKSQKEENENLFYLKRHKLSKKIKLNVLDTIKKNILKQKFFKIGNLITSITAKNNLIFAGNNQGIIKMYTCDKEYEIKIYTSKEIEAAALISVVSMDISQEEDFLIAGYSNGFIALWDIASTKCKKLINNIHKNSILCVKFIRSEKKKFEIISSDLDGFTYKLVLRDLFFTTTVDEYIILKKSAVYSINFLKFEEDIAKIYPELANGQYLIISLVSLDFILILMLEPQYKRLFEFGKPKYFKDFYVPDVSFGIGYVPNIHQDSPGESILDMTGNQSIIQAASNLDCLKYQILLSISWGHIIYLYCLPVENGVIHNFTMIGHYINNSPIIRMGFLSNSTIFLVSKKKFLKVINTSLLIPGEVSIFYENETPIVDPKPELDTGNILDSDLSFQLFVLDPEKITKETYINTIICTSKNLFILGKKDFHHIKLLNWEQCLIRMQQNGEWMDALSTGLDIYEARACALADIPMDNIKRKTCVGNVIKNIVNDYATIHIGRERGNLIYYDKSFQDSISKTVDICIEICLEINCVDFLFTSLQSMFDSKGYGDIFIHRLESFIICDKLLYHQLQQNIVSKIVELYIKKKKFDILSQILIHLGIKSIDIENVKFVCNEYNLISPLIYIYSNGVCEDYFYPIKKIFQIFEKTKETKPFTSYQECLTKMNIHELLISKHYIGHKLLWYINLCLNCKKYPLTNESKISEKKLKKFVKSLIIWLFSYEVFEILLKFDSNCLFLILSNFFKEQKLRSILENIKYDSYSAASNLKLTDLKFSSILELIMIKCKELNKNSVLHDMYEFIAKISIIQGIEIHNHLINETGKFLLTYSPDDVKNKELYIGNFPNFTEYIEHVSNCVIQMIIARTNLDKNDIYFLLSASESSPFVMVKIHLLKRSKSYKRCLEVFLQVENNIKEREKKVFNWIEDTFKELNNDDPVNFHLLKEETLNRLHLLADLSIDKVTKIVEDWFANEQDLVVKKLNKVETLQLRYVENVIEKFKKETDFQQENERKVEIYSSMLKVQIRLLCKLHPKLVLPNLKKRTSYPIEECLNTCLEYEVFDAAVYLYQSMGSYKDSLNLAIKVLDSTFQKITENLLSSGFKQDMNSTLINEFNVNLNQIMRICENNTDKVEVLDREEMWFQTLEKLYKMLSIVKDLAINNENMKSFFDEFYAKISHEIKETLEKMCSYVSLQKIITIVTDFYKHAEFKEFKIVLIKMLTSYSHMKNILVSTKSLLANSILYNIIELKKLNHKGNKYSMYQCDKCSKLLKPIEDVVIIAFACGHKCHIKCALIIDNDLICNICRENELENSITNSNIRSLISRGNISDSKIPKKSNGNNEKRETKSFNNISINRLIAFDKRKHSSKNISNYLYYLKSQFGSQKYN